MRYVLSWQSPHLWRGWWRSRCRGRWPARQWSPGLYTKLPTNLMDWIVIQFFCSKGFSAESPQKMHLFKINRGTPVCISQKNMKVRCNAIPVKVTEDIGADQYNILCTTFWVVVWDNVESFCTCSSISLWCFSSSATSASSPSIQLEIRAQQPGSWPSIKFTFTSTIKKMLKTG